MMSFVTRVFGRFLLSLIALFSGVSLKDVPMQLGRIVGTVVASQRTATTGDWSLRMVELVDVHNQTTGQYTVAVDAVGVGPGEVVMITQGSAARNSPLTASRPCDAIILAVVDTWEVGGTTQYRKDESLGDSECGN
jgi:microcompartment protein CcmK/EutM